MKDVRIHVEVTVRCKDCHHVFCKSCEDRCPSCYGIHITEERRPRAFPGKVRLLGD